MVPSGRRRICSFCSMTFIASFSSRSLQSVVIQTPIHPMQARAPLAQRRGELLMHRHIILVEFVLRQVDMLSVHRTQYVDNTSLEVMESSHRRPKDLRDAHTRHHGHLHHHLGGRIRSGSASSLWYTSASRLLSCALRYLNERDRVDIHRNVFPHHGQSPHIMSQVADVLACLPAHLLALTGLQIVEPVLYLDGLIASSRRSSNLSRRYLRLPRFVFWVCRRSVGSTSAI